MPIAAMSLTDESTKDVAEKVVAPSDQAGEHSELDLPSTTTSQEVPSRQPVNAEPETPVALKTVSTVPPLDKEPAVVRETPSVSSPAPRRPKPPTKGILKPPPPPAKPTLSNRLRDIVTVVGGGAKSLFEQPQEEQQPVAGPSSSTSSPHPPAPAAASGGVGGTLGALSGKLGLGFSRLVAGSPVGAGGGSYNNASPTGSPLASRSISLPETASTPLISEKSRQKQPLKRATFLLPSLSITYPISSTGEPWSQKVLEDRKRIEKTHRSLLTTTTGAEYWNSQRLVALYESACRGREERPRVGVVRALEVIPNSPRPRHIHLIHRPFDPNIPHTPPPPHALDTPLNRHSAESLADVLIAEWGLSDLKLEAGVIDGDDVLKPILHALLVSGTLPTLSLAGNKKIKAGGWRLLAVFLKRARSLRFIDLSDTSWDKKGIDYLVQSLNCTRIRPPPPPSTSIVSPDAKRLPNTPARAGGHDETEPLETGDELPNGHDSYGSFMPAAPLLKREEDDTKPAAVQTLRMDGCGLKANVLETLAQGIRSSDIKNISLRRNRIGPLGAVALALMIRDYPDSTLSMSSLSPQLQTLPSIHSPHVPSLDVNRTPSPSPYATRRRATSKPEGEESPLPPIPLVVSSPAGGVTSRTLPEGYKPPPPPKHPLVMPGGGNSAIQDAPTASFAVNNAQAEGKLSNPEVGGASMALQRSVRALDGVERIGRLLTLDLKSNEIRNGVGYIAQVLKRNRTLKVLNLSDNRIDATGLAALAEALKYNSSLETLDLSSNPCCGPSSEGISALRTAFTVNTSLKRLFLSDTGLTTDGAISLAEFLPESKSLLHLDITSNAQIDTAGILAISVGLRSNTLIRCLDVSIPPNNPELAELSQNILQACIRNTELAANAMKDGRAEGIWLPIKKSELVRQVKKADELRAEQERVDLATSPEGVAREFVYTLKPDKVGPVAEKTVSDLEKWYDAADVYTRLENGGGGHVWEPGQLPNDDYAPLVQRARVLRERLAEIIGDETDGAKLERLLGINDSITSVIEKSRGFRPPPRLLLPSQIVNTQPPQPPQQSQQSQTPLAAGGTRQFLSRRHMRIPSLEISSPNFSIGDSDNDSDPEEINVGDISHSSVITTPQKSGAQASTGEVGLGVGLEVEQPGLSEHDTSPVEKASRAWVEEEGEIFRKGTKLGVVADDDEVEDKEDVSGEQLKQEILDTPVARSPTRRVLSVEESENEAAIERAEAEREGSPP